MAGGIAAVAVARRSAAERLRLAQEVLALLNALLSDRQLDWALLDDICASTSSLRVFLTTTARLARAAAEPSLLPPGPYYSSPGLPLAPWASALLLRSSSTSLSPSSTPSSATSPSPSCQQQRGVREGGGCSGALLLLPPESHRRCSLHEVARISARVRQKVLQFTVTGGIRPKA